jgi:hypothetical protein
LVIAKRLVPKVAKAEASRDEIEALPLPPVVSRTTSLNGLLRCHDVAAVLCFWYRKLHQPTWLRFNSECPL